eukprot:scaffold269254_cov44-Prasinocladus_malaysianus.AAC.1
MAFNGVVCFAQASLAQKGVATVLQRLAGERLHVDLAPRGPRAGEDTRGVEPGVPAVASVLRIEGLAEPARQ